MIKVQNTSIKHRKYLNKNKNKKHVFLYVSLCLLSLCFYFALMFTFQKINRGNIRSKADDEYVLNNLTNINQLK